MAQILINQETEKFGTYDGFLEIDDGSDEHRMKFVQDMESSIDTDNFDRDHVDDGVAVFSQVGDVVGRFRFVLKNTVDLAVAANPPTIADVETASYWMNEIAAKRPPIVDFIETLEATESTGDPFARHRWKGRIMKVQKERIRDTGVRELVVEGEITEHTSYIRSAV